MLCFKPYKHLDEQESHVVMYSKDLIQQMRKISIYSSFIVGMFHVLHCVCGYEVQWNFP